MDLVEITIIEAPFPNVVMKEGVLHPQAKCSNLFTTWTYPEDGKELNDIATRKVKLQSFIASNCLNTAFKSF